MASCMLPREGLNAHMQSRETSSGRTYTKGTLLLIIINSNCFLESYFKFYFTLLCSSFQLSLALLVHYRYITVFSLRGLVPLSSNNFTRSTLNKNILFYTGLYYLF